MNSLPRNVILAGDFLCLGVGDQLFAELFRQQDRPNFAFQADVRPARFRRLDGQKFDLADPDAGGAEGCAVRPLAAARRRS